jgi:nitrogen fixation NifU-like protein
MIKGKKIDELLKVDKKDILDALGIEISAVRLKCALLPLKVLKMGIYSYLGDLTNIKE